MISSKANPVERVNEQIDAIIEYLSPEPYPNYNLGLLPDERGYNGEILDVKYYFNRRCSEAKSAIQSLIDKSYHQGYDDCLKEHGAVFKKPHKKTSEGEQG